MKNNLNRMNGAVNLFVVSILCIFAVSVWACPPTPPYAILKVSPEIKVMTLTTVLFDGSMSVSGSGSINRYSWDFDGNGAWDYYETPTYYPDGAFDGKTTFVFPYGGYLLNAKLSVQNTYNLSDIDIEQIYVKKINADISYTYNEVGNRTSMTDASGTTSYSYDLLGRLITVTNPDDKTISYQYDANGNRTQLTDPNGVITTYAYNSNNQLTEVNALSGLTTYQYDSLGNLIRADLPNGTYTQYAYSPQRNWLVSLVNREPNNSVLSSYSYTCDNTGNRLSVMEADGSVVTYGYDDIYQLTSETRTGANAYSITYQYDVAGNRTQMVKNSVITSYAYIGNKLWTETTNGVVTTYTHDWNGNLWYKTDGVNSVSYHWDWNNRLLSVWQAGGSIAYAYDGDGNRISKTQNGVKTKYINDVALPLVQVLQETDDAGTMQAGYTYGQGFISMNRAGVNSYYHCDGLGSSRQLTDFAGVLVASYTYDSFGNVISQNTGGEMASILLEEKHANNKAEISLFAFLGLGVGIVSIRNRKQGVLILLIISLIVGQIPRAAAVEADVTGNPSGFTGEQQFGEADDLVFLRHRYYNPSIGRFISRDPILSPLQLGDNIFWSLPYLTGHPQIMNPYVYCGNNPVNNIDPEGMLHIIVIIFLGGIAIIALIGTIACLLAIKKAMKKAEEEKKKQPDNECGNTQDRWKNTWDDFKNAIGACGTPIYVG
jgi:RHS repeat-associated protein